MASGNEWSGKLSLETRQFFHKGLQRQPRSHYSTSGTLDYYTDWNDGYDSFSFSGFARLDSADEERTHADIRELSWIHVAEDYELRTGVRKVFWGVTEGIHLVDIINQTDLVEGFEGEEKLGQPMVNLSFERDWGLVDLFILPWFRERNFPGDDGRLRIPVTVNTHDVVYASGAGQHRLDVAARWSHSLGDLEIGLSHFSGTSREPRFTLQTFGDNGQGVPTAAELVPVYETIDQTGLELQYSLADWVLKLEAISRSGQGRRFTALTTGVEYTQVGIFDSRIDLGWVAEYAFDDRKRLAPAGSMEHDILLATRWNFNDANSSYALAGLFWDHISHERLFSLEANTRLTESLLLNINLILVDSRELKTDDASRLASLIDPASPQSGFNAATEEVMDYYSVRKMGFIRQDDYLQMAISWYF
ncbi:hypothetical protein GCM10023116_16580 [Kistimonas scapharcae]|uniref:TonB-dependent receptor-like beta-barrel domain-containing protein n=1 Tax=Kistimonas scapharcae TaxID=1036133 RepID=A0ABP8V1C6_9GAMM